MWAAIFAACIAFSVLSSSLAVLVFALNRMDASEMFHLPILLF